MIYREARARPPLAPWVDRLWYVRTPGAVHGRQRVFPSGRAELVINLAADHFTGCAEGTEDRRQAPILLSGVRPSFGLIESCDLAETLGVSFAPGGLAMFFRHPADRLCEEIGLEDLWGPPARDLRQRLGEAGSLASRFEVLTAFLEKQLLPKPVHGAVCWALRRIEQASAQDGVAALAREAGLSARRFGELFSGAVGVSPKRYLRIRRFRQTLERLHAGEDPGWAALALDLGYCDQSHLNRDFRAFSGMTPTTYLAAERPWAGHAAMLSD